MEAAAERKPGPETEGNLMMPRAFGQRETGRWMAALAAGGGLVAGGLAVLGGPSAAGAAPPQATICTGTLSPGTYRSITVPPGATCNAGIGPLRVLAGVDVGRGATFMLGFEGGPPTGTIGGGVRALDAAQVQVHDARITGGVDTRGGTGPFGCTGPVPGLCFSDFEDNSISGGTVIDGYNGFFLGFIRNTVNGAVRITNADLPDELDIGSNVVHGSLTCSGNVPTENTGGSPGPTPDIVTGRNTCHEVAS